MTPLQTLQDLDDAGLDARCATVVMGWPESHGFHCRGEAPDKVKCEPSHGSVQFTYWSPSTDLVAMFAVLARLRVRYPNWRVVIEMPSADATGKLFRGHVYVWTFHGCIASVPFDTESELPRAGSIAALLSMS